MNYERGFAVMRDWLPSDRLEEFETLLKAWRQARRDERLYGAAPTSSQEQHKAYGGLLELARECGFDLQEAVMRGGTDLNVQLAESRRAVERLRGLYGLNRGAATELEQLLSVKAIRPRPRVVCLCGSTKFTREFHEANLRETLAGRIVLTIGCDMRSDEDLQIAGELTAADKERLDVLHLWKIDLADEVLVLNVNGYLGESTRREVEYARQCGKRVRWLEPPQARRG